jgi:hypothetical protein
VEAVLRGDPGRTPLSLLATTAVTAQSRVEREWNPNAGDEVVEGDML